MTRLAYLPESLLVTAMWLCRAVGVFPAFAWKCELELWMRDLAAEGAMKPIR